MTGAWMIAAALAAQVGPSAQAERLGLELAQSGTLATVLPLMERKEVEELVASHPELSEGDKAALRATAERVAADGIGRLMAALGHAYAARLTVDDLRRLVAFNRTAAAQHYRAAAPAAVAATMESVGTINFKQETLTAFCAETGKACPAR